MFTLSTRLSSLGRRSSVAPPERHAELPPLHPPVEIPIREPGPDAEAAARLRARGRFLARQEDWDRLAEEISAADRDRALTPGLRSEAALLSDGARSDISEAVAEAVAAGEPRRVQAALSSLETVLSERPSCPVIAQIVAMAHVEAARAWGVSGPEAAEARAQQRRHMAVASRLNDRFDPFEHDMPLWALVRCAVLDADPHPQARVADDYEDLIDLDPGNPHHLQALGQALRPGCYGSWTALDQQARRTARETADVWGQGGYSWVYAGALSEDPQAFRRLDAALFVEGLHDILARVPTQDMANRLAALTGFTLGGKGAAEGKRRLIADCLGWITQDHLRELHPEVWAEATRPCQDRGAVSEEADAARRGRGRALSALGGYYAAALQAGRRLIFDAEGMHMVKQG